MGLLNIVIILAFTARLSCNQLIRDYQVYVGVITTLYKHYNARNVFLVYGMDSSIGKSILLTIYTRILI